MKYPEEMYIDSQIFAGDMDGSESNLTEKNRKDKISSFVLHMRKTYI